MRDHSGGAYSVPIPVFIPGLMPFWGFICATRKAPLLLKNTSRRNVREKKRPSQQQGAEPNTYESDPQKGRTFIIGPLRQDFSSFSTKVVATS